MYILIINLKNSFKCEAVLYNSSTIGDMDNRVIRVFLDFRAKAIYLLPTSKVVCGEKINFIKGHLNYRVLVIFKRGTF